MHSFIPIKNFPMDAHLPKHSRPTHVVHCERDSYDVYIGRPSIWGNPFKVEDLGRKDCINRYREWIMYSEEASDLRNQLPSLKGKTLGCWCKPKACHGDVLVELIESGVLELISYD